MPRIEKPTEGLGPDTGRLSGRTAIGGTTQIADEARRVGNQLEQTGRQYFEVAKKSIQTSTYNDAISKATLTYNQRVQERLEQKVDEEGNPTYMNLSSDINKIGQEVQSEMSMKLLDPEVRNRFNRSYADLTTRTQLKAQGEARRRHLEFATAASAKAIQTTVEASKQGDPNDAVAGIAHLTDIIETDFEAGVYSRQQADKLIETGAREIKISVAQKAIQEDPAGAKAFLEGQEAQALGLTSTDKLMLQKTADKALQDLQANHNKIMKQTRNVIKDQQISNAQDLEIGIINGTIGAKEVEESYNSNMDVTGLANSVDGQIYTEIVAEENKNISKKDYVKLLSRVKRKEAEDVKDNAFKERFQEAMNNGELLEEKFTTKEINKVVQDKAKLIAGRDEQGNQNEPTLTHLVQASLPVKAPMKSVTKSLVGRIKNGSLDNPESLKEAIEMYHVLETYNNVALEPLEPKDEAALQLARDLMVKDMATPEEAVERTRDAIYKSDDEAENKRRRGFSRKKEFKSDNINNTIDEMLDRKEFLLGFLGQGRPTKFSYEMETEAYIEDLLRETYINGDGDVDRTLEVVRKRLDRTHGISNFNGRDEFMFLPPEKVYAEALAARGGDVREGARFIRQSLENLYRPMLPKGVSSEQIEIHADTLSRVPGQPFSYGVYYRDENGDLAELVIDEDGTPERWAYDPKEGTELFEEQQVEEFKKDVERGDSFFSGRISPQEGEIYCQDLLKAI